MDVCEVCECSPCDCHGMNDEKKELWGMGQDSSDKRRENNGMDGKGSWCQSVPAIQVAPGGCPQDRILSEGLQCTCNYTGKAYQWDNPGRGAGPGDRD